MRDDSAIRRRKLFPWAVSLVSFASITVVIVLYNSANTSWKENNTKFQSKPDIIERFQTSSFLQRRALLNSSSVIFWSKNGFEPFLSMFPDLDRVNETDPVQTQAIWNNTQRDLVRDSRLCPAAMHFKEAGSLKRHILFTHFNENWGALSGYVPNRTVDWGPMESTFGRCTPEEVMAYLDHPNTLAVITTQFQQMDHPKVHSIPLGIKDSKYMTMMQRNDMPNRTQLVLLNFGRPTTFPPRLQQEQVLLHNFNGTLKNMYYEKPTTGTLEQQYVADLQRSMFVFSPSGLGWDTYRNWDALALGAIPVIERYNRSDGWHRTFEDLPVLWVDRLDQVTPELLRTAYVQIAARFHTYRYEKLTYRWWLDFIHSLRFNDA